jgi:2'-5' RNA ligase
MKRTFVAIPVTPSPELLELFRRARGLLTGSGMKWVDPESLHLTLKFLGNTDERKIPEIQQQMEISGSAFFKASGKLTALDYFASQGNPTVLFSKICGLPGLEELALRVDEAMKTAGFMPEQRKFRPHLTLARIKFLQDKGKFLNLIRHYQDIEIQTFTAKEMILYESILRPEGPLYIPLYTFTFPD